MNSNKQLGTNRRGDVSNTSHAMNCKKRESNSIRQKKKRKRKRETDSKRHDH